MKLITDEELKNLILSKTKQLKRDLLDLGSKDIQIMQIKEMEKYILDCQKESRIKTKEYYNRPLSLAYIGVMSVGLLSILIELGDESILEGWHDSQNINTGYVLGSLFRQITNSSLAVIRLIEDGLDYQARILVGSTCELSWITLAIMSDQNMMELYAQDLDKDQELENWREYFSAKKLLEKLSLIEKELGLPDILADKLKKARLDIYDFYSNSLRNSYSFCTLGSFSKQINNGNYVPNTFGMASLFSKPTIQSLNDFLFYFLANLSPIMKYLQKFMVQEHPDLWNFMQILRECYITSYIEQESISNLN
jgi:hypothetical protein